MNKFISLNMATAFSLTSVIAKQKKLNSLNTAWPCCFVLFITSLLSACIDSSSVSSLTKKSLIYCSEASPESFNPQTSLNQTTLDATSNQIYDRLITIDPSDNTLKPSLAKSWHVTRDGTKVTFYLRKDIHFHATDYFFPSRTLDADDVIFSFQRILNPEHDFHYVSGGHYPYFEQIKFNKLVSSVEKINQYTVRFNLHVPDASFLAHLATPYAVILSSEYGSILTEKNMRSYIDTHPIGTGPFKLQEFRAGSLIRFYQHKDYWRKSMPFEQLVYDITTSNTGRLTKLMTGECDIISDPIGHNKITERKDLTLESVTSLDVAYLALNTLKTPLNEPLVRQAINLAINKEAIINATYLGHAVVADSLLPPTSWAFQTTYNNKEYNPEKAKALLAQAGFEQGFEMDLWAPPETTSYNPNSLTMAILIQEDLRSIGITVNIIHDHPPVIIGMSEPANYDSMLSGWSANHPDPDNFFSYLLSCDATLTGSNRAFWCHQTFDSLLEKGLHTAQIEQRKYHYQQALNLLATEMPIIPIAHSKTYKAKNNKISGNFFNNFGVNFINVSKK